MESHAISDDQINASSVFAPRYSPWNGRINLTAGTGCWSASRNDLNQWLQIDLISECTQVTRVATQGRHSHNQWVTAYHLQYSNDTVNFQHYREQGQNSTKVYIYRLTSHIHIHILVEDFSYVENPTSKTWYANRSVYFGRLDAPLRITTCSLEFSAFSSI